MYRKKLITLALLSPLWGVGGLSVGLHAQPNTWNTPLTQIMVDHNKTNYSDHQQANQNQVLLTASATQVQTEKNKCKKLMDTLDKKLNDIAIVLADVVTTAKIAEAMKDIYQYQSEAAVLAAQHPIGILL
jgi:hypothetical protein